MTRTEIEASRERITSYLEHQGDKESMALVCKMAAAFADGVEMVEEVSKEIASHIKYAHEKTERLYGNTLHCFPCYVICGTDDKEPDCQNKFDCYEHVSEALRTIVIRHMHGEDKKGEA